MIPALLVGKILKKIVPKILDILMKQFPGLEKIEKLVNYMEKPNEADEGISKLKKQMLDKDLKIHELTMRLDNYEDITLEVQKKIRNITKNA